MDTLREARVALAEMIRDHEEEMERRRAADREEQRELLTRGYRAKP
jgi:hypothetical protein